MFIIDFLKEFANSDIAKTIIQNGFLLLIVRQVLTGIRDAFQKRQKEVEFAKLLRAEVVDNEKLLTEFYTDICALVIKNNGTFGHRFYHFQPTSNVIYANNASTLIPYLEKYQLNSSENLRLLYNLFDRYNTYLGFYEDLITTPTAMNFTRDPTVKFKDKCERQNFQGIQEHKKVIENATQLIIEGKGFWRFIKKKNLLLVIKIVLVLFLIFIPDEEAL